MRKTNGAHVRAPHRAGVGGFVRTQAPARLELASRSRSVRSAWERVSCPYATGSTERTIAPIPGVSRVIQSAAREETRQRAFFPVAWDYSACGYGAVVTNRTSAPAP
jgi:hypothetical protein